jgi:TolA-binding protein
VDVPSPAPAPEPVTAVEPPAPAPATPAIPMQPQPEPASEPQKVAMLGPAERPIAPTHNVPAVITEDPYETAVKLEKERRYQEAAGLLEQVANAHGERSELALAELGFVEQKNLNQASRALDTLTQYERDYPRGSMIAEVELSVIELELARSKKTEALTQMRKFLAEHPGNERAPEVHLLEGNVLREQGDCQGAVTQYAQATSPALQDDALYFTAWCQQQLGHAADAEASMHRYQNEFPNGRHAAQVKEALQGR